MGLKATLMLTANEKNLILELLNQYLPNTEVWAYGSRIKGTAKSYSDLDLVAFSKPEQSAQISLLQEAFEESDLPFRIDLFIWNEVPEQFQNNIQAQHLKLT